MTVRHLNFRCNFNFDVPPIIIISKIGIIEIKLSIKTPNNTKGLRQSGFLKLKAHLKHYEWHPDQLH